MTVSSMPQPAQPDHNTSPTDEVILGVDTHKDLHVAAVITAVGAVAASRSFPTTKAGYHQLLAWAHSFGTLRRAGVECTGSYGAALTRHLQAAGITVIEVNQPDKATHRRRGKTDTIDAQAAARAVLSGRATATAKTGDGPVRCCGCSSSPRAQRSSPAPRRSTSSRRSWWPRTRRYVRRCQA
jgi:transposase